MGYSAFYFRGLASPKTVGGLDTFDPLDPSVADWWRNESRCYYAAIPDFAASYQSRFRKAASASFYGRHAADAANVIARALNPHHGVVFYRLSSTIITSLARSKNDRAKLPTTISSARRPVETTSSYKSSMVQSTSGARTGFAASQVASKNQRGDQVQVTQEYTGQQHHLCFLIPMWKEVLDFDLHRDGVTTK